MTLIYDEPKFTPGPWFYKLGYVFAEQFRKIRFVKRPAIAVLERGGLEPGDEQGEADGKLMAASPDLYNACVVLLDAFDEGSAGANWRQKRIEKARDLARAAVTKALVGDLKRG